MKYRFIVFIILFMLLTSSNFADDIWSKIENKTWVSKEIGAYGAQIVFLNNKFGEKRAIFQLQGSGCYVIATEVFNVDIINDTIKLENSDSILDNSSGLNSSIFIFSDEENILLDVTDTSKYYIISEEPLLYKLCSKKVDIEALKNDTITINNFLK